jgi:protein phosphatase
VSATGVPGDEQRIQALVDDCGRLLANASTVTTLPERLSRYLDGRVDGRSADVIPLTLQPGDRILLCSDGLSSFVAETYIRAVLSDNDLERAADRLVQLALDRSIVSRSSSSGSK